ncbi:Transporter of the ATP-binding cassette (ABC), partial [Coemansia guatemalensis]
MATVGQKSTSDAEHTKGDDKHGSGDNTAGSTSSSQGKIANLMAVDTQKIAEMASLIYLLYEFPIQIAVTVLMLYQLLGIAAFGSLGALLLISPIQAWLSSIWRGYQRRIMSFSDQRMDITNEVLQGVRIIKYFAWESHVEKQVAGIRSGELKVLRKQFMTSAHSLMLFFMVPVLITLAAFSMYTGILGHQLTASVAFTALSLLKTLRAPLDGLLYCISLILQAKVSVDRVDQYLAEEDTPKYKLLQATSSVCNMPTAGTCNSTDINTATTAEVGFVNASF